LEGLQIVNPETSLMGGINALATLHLLEKAYPGFQGLLRSAANVALVILDHWQCLLLDGSHICWTHNFLELMQNCRCRCLWMQLVIGLVQMSRHALPESFFETPGRTLKVPEGLDIETHEPPVILPKSQ
jgi:hypothetical protein